jgi:hypothetical protein
VSNPPVSSPPPTHATGGRSGPTKHPGANKPPTHPAKAAKPHPHKSPTANLPKRPHPHKTLRPKPVHGPTANRPHPHRKPWPITLTVRTVPALAGVQLSFDGHLLVTDALGLATYTAEHDFAAHRLSVISTSIAQPDRRYQFSRWAGQRDPNQAFSHTVSALPLRSDYSITAAFAVQQQVSPRLIRQDGTPLDPTLVSAITARSDSGQLVNLPLNGPTWLDGVRPAYHHSALTAEPVKYSLQSVIVRGTNVVDAGRQSFAPSVTTSPTFTTQFHDLTITAHDAMFGTSRGDHAVVTFPDGGKLTVPLNSQHVATLTDLPRGTYRVVVKAGSAIVATQQFTLSKDKTADLPVISLLDIAVLLGVLLMIAAVLLIVGRQYWHRLIDRTGQAIGRRQQVREEILT